MQSEKRFMPLATKKRPAVITTACIIGYIAVVFYFIGVFSPAIKKLGDFYPALLGVLVAANFISVVGVWHLKRWGADLFILVFFLKLILLLLVDSVGIPGTIVSIYFIASVLPYYKQLDPNL